MSCSHTKPGGSSRRHLQQSSCADDTDGSIAYSRHGQPCGLHFLDLGCSPSIAACTPADVLATLRAVTDANEHISLDSITV
jgi:hypothetical protein